MQIRPISILFLHQVLKKVFFSSSQKWPWPVAISIKTTWAEPLNQFALPAGCPSFQVKHSSSLLSVETLSQHKISWCTLSPKKYHFSSIIYADDLTLFTLNLPPKRTNRIHVSPWLRHRFQLQSHVFLFFPLTEITLCTRNEPPKNPKTSFYLPPKKQKKMLRPHVSQKNSPNLTSTRPQWYDRANLASPSFDGQ